MRRAAFTLIEVIISVTILAIISIAMIKMLSDIKLSNSTMDRQNKKIAKKEKIYKLLYTDIKNSPNTNIFIDNSDIDYSLVSMITKHSLYTRENAMLTYIVKDNILYRVESDQPFQGKFLSSDDIDIIAKVDRFKLFQNSNGSKIIDIRYGGTIINFMIK
jgi:prepilin-type N-terminal cleavage/methylation domain-containing protein